MPKRKQRPLTRPGEPTQTTGKGLEIPVPTREEFFGLLKKGITKKAPEPPSGPGPASR